MLRTVQRAKEATEGVIAALKELKKSLMQHLFTYGPVPVAERERVPLQETEIGPLPAHWRVVRLGEVVYHVRDTINPMSYPDERFEYYSIPAYQGGQQPALETGREIRSVKIVVQSGTVLFGKLNPRVPKIWLVESASPRRKIASTEFIALVPNYVQLDSSFLYFLSWTPFVLSKAQELIAGSTPSRQRVDVRAFLQLPIPLPPLSEQREIARMLQAVDAKIAAEQTRRAALEDLFKTLLHELMSGRRRVSLATQNLGE
jgi:type I restriction enzyme S subunit